MNTFHLKIVTPEGVSINEEIQSVTVRTAAGDVGILAGHANYAAPIDTGIVRITDKQGHSRMGECADGILSVRDGKARIIAGKFVWKEER